MTLKKLKKIIDKALVECGNIEINAVSFSHHGYSTESIYHRKIKIEKFSIDYVSSGNYLIIETKAK